LKLTNQEKHQPVYSDLIRGVQKGFQLLDEHSCSEVISFIKSQQHVSGAFVNRGGNPDLYYSLFGVWISEALGLNNQKQQLLAYTEIFNPNDNNLTDRYAILLMRHSLHENHIYKPNTFFFLKTFFYSGKNINLVYRGFLFLLSFDAFYEGKKFLHLLLKTGLKFYKVPDDVPSSFRAAWLVAKQMVGLDVTKDIQQLFEYYEEGIGFKAFKEVESPDLLSTAVALFALKKAGAGLKTIAPEVLGLVQSNYSEGAFLAGNGDETRDLEYTFYGLLILGTLS
jgi:hypothetical protein